MKKKLFGVFICLLFSFLLEREIEAKTIILVSLPPQAFIVKNLIPKELKEEIEVQNLVGPGQNYHSYEVPPRDVEKFSKATVFLTLGIPFENNLLKKFKENSSKLKIIPMDKGIVRRKMQEQEEVHNHDHDRDHDHAFGDPHIWLSLENVKTMGQNTSEALKLEFPKQGENLEAQALIFKSRIEDLKKTFEKNLKPFKGKTLYVYHPSFGYFTDEFGLYQRSIEINGRSPGPRELQAFIERAKKEKAQVIFFQPQFDKRSCEVVAGTLSKSLGKKVIVASLDALAEDIFKTLLEIQEGLILSSKGE